MATSPRNLTTHEYPQGVNEIAQNDLNPPTFQTESNPTPPMDLGQALLRYHSAGYGEVRNGNSEPLETAILDELWDRVDERELHESEEWKKDMRAGMWKHGILREGVKDMIQHLFESPWAEWLDTYENGRDWMDYYFQDVNDIYGVVMHEEKDILSIYGLDRAMDDFSDEFTPRKPGSYQGLENFIAGRCYEEAICPFAWFMFKAMRETMAKLPTSVGECVLCCDESSVLLTLPCGHAFGAACLRDWVATKSQNDEPKTCPMCRVEFYPHPLFECIVY